MKTPVYDLLDYKNPTMLNRLYLYQQHWYDKGITLPEVPDERAPLTIITISGVK